MRALQNATSFLFSHLQVCWSLRTCAAHWLRATRPSLFIMLCFNAWLIARDSLHSVRAIAKVAVNCFDTLSTMNHSRLAAEEEESMGLCKCRTVTTLFCFQHRINVCEQCMVRDHSKVWQILLYDIHCIEFVIAFCMCSAPSITSSHTLDYLS